MCKFYGIRCFPFKFVNIRKIQMILRGKSLGLIMNQSLHIFLHKKENNIHYTIHHTTHTILYTTQHTLHYTPHNITYTTLYTTQHTLHYTPHNTHYTIHHTTYTTLYTTQHNIHYTIQHTNIFPIHHRNAIFRGRCHCLLSSVYRQLRRERDEGSVTHKHSL
jgi:hypothetical protein